MANGGAKMTRDGFKTLQKWSKRSAKLINEEVIEGKREIIFYRKNIRWKHQRKTSKMSPIAGRGVQDEPFRPGRETVLHQPCTFVMPQDKHQNLMKLVLVLGVLQVWFIYKELRLGSVSFFRPNRECALFASSCPLQSICEHSLFCNCGEMTQVNFSSVWIPWNLSFRYIHCTGQFTPKMKANAEPRLLSSLVWIDSGVEVSQHCLESLFMK